VIVVVVRVSVNERLGRRGGRHIAGRRDACQD
jgi:hypothetical protein